VGKLTISLPDDLEEEARRAWPDTAFSQIVQNALNQQLHDGGAPPRPVVDLSEDALMKVEAVTNRIREDAQLSYTKGYMEGIEFADDFGWRSLDSLPLDSTRSLYRALPRVIHAYSESVPDQQIDTDAVMDWFHELEQDSAARAGFLRALQDLHRAAMESSRVRQAD
jgi:hypothetical protein